MSDEQAEQPEVSEEFKNVPAEELQKYLDQSGLQPGEDADKWASRNRLEREKLLAKYPANTEQ
jgi:hypothetical protein